MIIILTGVDGTGKTTLFNKLKTHLKYTSYISEPYPGPSIVFRKVRKTQLEHFVKYRRDVNVVYDRATLIDDLIYQRLFNHTASIFEKNLKSIARTLSHTLIIRLTANDEVLLSRISARGDAYVSTEQLSLISQNYDTLFSTLNLNIHTIDTSELTAHQVFKQTLAIINERT